jgi:hypothetical protein
MSETHIKKQSKKKHPKEISENSKEMARKLGRRKQSKYGGNKNKDKYNKETRPPRYSKVQKSDPKSDQN